MKIIEIPKEEVQTTYFEHNPERQIIQRVTLKRDFKGFLLDAINGNQLFGKGAVNIRRGVKILDAIESANGTIALEDDLYSALKDSVEQLNWNTAFAIQAERQGYFSAVEKAEEVKK